MEPRWRAALDEFDDTELMVAALVVDRLADYFDALLEDDVPGAGSSTASAEIARPQSS
jgi:hypothetical protein